MIHEALVGLAAVTLLLLGIALMVVGFMMASKFMQATGFMSGVIALVLFYYTWALGRKEEPEEV
ncbi:hypothetical protein Mtc_1909 [Methanocella conradii HZ254]|uniref:Uncharacterized protein n=1 Tax=Methanocella conradii (strain DSM 24694 / JCM 17849 / CGMCC 1.5162 / HZ254) TaxID=1041930 RepID=H8I4Q4_METCZ|nr:hypothetical protein [Methanocella conradii]AFD00649.1 hypothetical protein Mtc_1909 [Methanocella conradii HZ254]